jgi:hypothetical protein
MLCGIDSLTAAYVQVIGLQRASSSTDLVLARLWYRVTKLLGCVQPGLDSIKTIM